MTTNTPTNQRWRIILNPVSGRGRGTTGRAELEKLLEQYAPPGAGWWITETKSSGDAIKLARAARASEFSGIAAAGGDGTLGETLNGIMTGEGEGTARMAVLPMGTGNDFARCIGINTSLEVAVQAMFAGTAKKIDVGKVHAANGYERYFVNVAGCGFDAVVAERINTGYRRLRGTPAYIAAVLQTLQTFRGVPLNLEADGEKHALGALMCAVANATSYGGGMRIAPEAKLDDGQFDICVIGDASRLEFLRAFPKVFSGTHVTHPKVTMLKAGAVRIESEPALSVLADGEIVGTTPVQFEIVPSAIEMMMPPAARV